MHEGSSPSARTRPIRRRRMAFFSFLFYFSSVRCLCKVNALLSAYRLRFRILNSRIRLFCMQRDTHRLSRWFFSCGPKGLACQLRLPALVRFTLANYFPLPVNGSSKFSVSCSLISSSSSWFCIYFRIFPSFFPTVLT